MECRLHARHASREISTPEAIDSCSIVSGPRWQPPALIGLTTLCAAAIRAAESGIRLCRPDFRRRLVLSAQSRTPGAGKAVWRPDRDHLRRERTGDRRRRARDPPAGGQGLPVIFTTSFGYMEPTLKVAKLFPKVSFEHATGYKTRPTWSPTRRASTKAPICSACSPGA